MSSEHFNYAQMDELTEFIVNKIHFAYSSDETSDREKLGQARAYVDVIRKMERMRIEADLEDVPF